MAYIKKAFYGKDKKIAVVKIDNYSLADKIVETLRKEGYRKIRVFEGTDNCPALHEVSQYDPDFAIVVKRSGMCRIRSIHLDTAVIRGKAQEAREKSFKARYIFRYYFRVIGIEANISGKILIPRSDVKFMPHRDYFEFGAPFIHMCVPDEEGVPLATMKAISNYFKEYGYEEPEEEKKDCPNCLYGVVSRGE